MENNFLLSPQILEALHLQSKELSRHQLSTGANAHAGSQQSKHRGTGLELQDLRSYQTGDDIRHIAWRASARSSKPMVKIFHAEKQERRLLTIDQHPGMYFGTRNELKAAIAVQVTALLCFTALHKNTEIGAITGTQTESIYPFSQQLHKTLDIIRSINSGTKTKTQIPPETLLKHTQNVATKECEIYVVSDFLNWDKNTLTTLGQFKHQHRVRAIQIIDPGEYELPDIGKIHLTSPDSNHTGIINSGHKILRQRYKDEMHQRQQTIEDILKQQGIELFKVMTDADPIQLLEQWQ